MSSDIRRIAGFITLAIPFLALAAMIVLNHGRVNNYPEYRFVIEGYDPVDLLRGHYMTFRYKDIKTENYSARGKSCACLSGPPEKPVIAVQSCRMAKSCAAHLKLEYDQPPQELRQYYIPEAEALRLESTLRQDQAVFEVGVAVRPGGSGQIRMMYVDGKPLNDYLDSLPPVSSPVLP